MVHRNFKEDKMYNSRRFFLKQGGIALFGLGLTGIPQFVKGAAAQQKVIAGKKILVCIFQRGAMDGLMAVSPFNDTHLQKVRPGLFMSPGNGKQMIDLDGQFGLHPGFKSFESSFRQGQMAIVHGMGSPNQTRSHFDAQDYMESGTPFKKGTQSGWLNRALDQLPKEMSGIFRGVSLTNSLPRSLYGEYPCLAVADFNNFKIRSKAGKNVNLTAASSFEELYDLTTDELQKKTSKESFEAMKMVDQLNFKNYQPANGVQYPNSTLGNALKQITQLIKSDVGLEIAFTESNGWDTHFNQGTENGVFARNADDLSKSITAMWNDLGNFQENVVIMTMTEFGRTVKQNGTNGTDHGRASCSFILGQDVAGSKVYHKMSDLSAENLEDGRDLPVTIDFREVFYEIASKHLKVNDKSALFPDWEGRGFKIMK